MGADGTSKNSLMTLRVTVVHLPPSVTDNCELVLRFLNPSDQAVEVVVQSAVLDEGGQVCLRMKCARGQLPSLEEAGRVGGKGGKGAG